MSLSQLLQICKEYEDIQKKKTKIIKKNQKYSRRFPRIAIKDNNISQLQFANQYSIQKNYIIEEIKQQQPKISTPCQTELVISDDIINTNPFLIGIIQQHKSIEYLNTLKQQQQESINIIHSVSSKELDQLQFEIHRLEFEISQIPRTNQKELINTQKQQLETLNSELVELQQQEKDLQEQSNQYRTQLKKYVQDDL